MFGAEDVALGAAAGLAGEDAGLEIVGGESGASKSTTLPEESSFSFRTKTLPLPIFLFGDKKSQKDSSLSRNAPPAVDIGMPGSAECDSRK